MPRNYVKKNEKYMCRARDNYFLRLGSHRCPCDYFSGYSIITADTREPLHTK